MDLSIYDQLLDANATYVRDGGHYMVPVRPARRLTVLTCMDSRIDVFAVLGLELGQAHVIRNGGARVTDDVLRSLTMSTALLGTHYLIQIAHTNCGAFDPDDQIEVRLEQELGRPVACHDWYTFADPRQALREDADKLRQWEDRPADFAVGAYLFDVENGALEQVVAPHVVPGA